MIKRAPSRNQKPKGIRVKHVLQICLLLGVCFWLLYQVKRSHDKKAALDEKNAKTSVRTVRDIELPKLGRKDLPHKEITEDEKQEEEEEEDTAGEEEKKHEVEVQDEDQKHEVEEQEDEDQKHGDTEDKKHEAEEREEEENTKEDREDEGRGGGDDEIDESEQEKKEGEADHEEEFVDEEKEREDERDDKDTDRNEGEEKDDQAEIENSLDDQDNDGGEKNAHEAREEHYKGDDASSAVVTHNAQVISTETEKVSSNNSNENSVGNSREKEIKSDESKEVSGNQNNSRIVEDRMAENGTSSNLAANEVKVNEDMSNPVESSLINGTVKLQSNGLLEGGDNLTVVSAETNNSTISSTEASNKSYHQNGTETVPESVDSKNAAVDGTTTGEGVTKQTLDVEQTNNTASRNYQSDSNSTVSAKIEDADRALGESSNTSNKVETTVSEKILRSDGTDKTENGSSSPTVKEITDGTHNEESNGTSESGKTEEGSDSTKGTEDVVQHDPIDSSDSHITEDEKEARTDLNTLPDIRTEGDENGEAAAE